MKKRVALLYGGASSEHDVSRMGYEYVSKLLMNNEYKTIPVYVSRSGEWSVNLDGTTFSVCPVPNQGGSLYTGYGYVKIDAAIPLLHGEGGEDGSIQGALECAHIPYIGADVATSALCLDKIYTKAVASSLGIPTVKSVIPAKNESPESLMERCQRELGFPVFIKPRRLGSSVGAYPVQSEDSFAECYSAAASVCDGLVMIEKCLEEKRELECAYAEINGEEIITPPGEIVIDGFYGYSEKYGGKTRTAPIADVDEKTSKLINDYCHRLSNGLRLRHLARIDFFLFGEEVYFNEINTFPGFTSESLYPKILKAHGIDPREALLSFIKDALSC